MIDPPYDPDDLEDDEPGTAASGSGDLAGYLRRAALFYCERYASSEANLERVLRRKARRRMAERGIEADPARPIAEAIATCRRLGLVDDRAYAETKVAAGRRRGLGAGRIAAGLAAKGVERGTIATALQEAAEGEGPDAALVAALVFARRKRLGPWRSRPVEDGGRRDMAALCRGGHEPGVARRVVGLDREAAEAVLHGEAT